MVRSGGRLVLANMGGGRGADHSYNNSVTHTRQVLQAIMHTIRAIQ